MSSEIYDKARKTLAQIAIPERQTYFQMQRFVVGKECTVQAQLWQTLKELQVKTDNLDSLQMQIEDAEDNLSLQEIHIERIRQSSSEVKDGLDLKEIEINIRKAERVRRAMLDSIEKLKTKMRYILEEIQYFVEAFERLSKIEKVRPFDDVEAQREYWNEKLSEQLNLCLLLKNPVNSELIRTILALDDNAPVKKMVVSMLENIQQRMVDERSRKQESQTLVNRRASG